MVARWIAVLGCAVLLAQPTFGADALTGTLQKIGQTGRLAIGYRESSIPFSYLDAHNRPIGYTLELCDGVVAAVRARLAPTPIAVELVPVNTANRIPLLQAGTIDIECGATSNLLDKHSQVAFGPTFFVTRIVASVRADSALHDWKDLAGKTVVTSAGSSSVALFKRYAREQRITVRELTGKDHADSFLLLASGRADALVLDDIQQAGLIANAEDPKSYRYLPGSLRSEPMAVMIRRDDPAFKQLVDAAFAEQIRSGRARELYTKWFTRAIPPRGVNLGVQPNPETARALREPDDRGAR